MKLEFLINFVSRTYQRDLRKEAAGGKVYLAFAVNFRILMSQFESLLN
jgi:hypothetical protein